MPIKMTQFLQITTNVSLTAGTLQRIGGWSEGWYYPGTSIQGAIDAYTTEIAGLPALGAARGALLPRGGAIVGQRFQQVNPTGPSQSTAFRFTGEFMNNTDQPQAALLMRVKALNANNVRLHIIRGIPDIQLVEGEFSPQPGYLTSVNRYISSLGNWLFRGRDLSIQPVNIFTISSAGLVTTEAPHGLVVNDLVLIQKSLDADGLFVSGRFMVATVGPGTNAFTTTAWTAGACTGGRVRKDGIVFPTVNPGQTTVSRAVVKKVGRPFVQYRGRASRRRR